MSRIWSLSRLFLTSNSRCRSISTSGGGKESSTANSTTASPEVEPEGIPEGMDPVAERRRNLPNPEGIEEASKSWLGQLPHEEDPTVGYDIFKKITLPDGSEYFAGQSVSGNSWAANIFPTSMMIKVQTKKDWSLDGYRRHKQRKDHIKLVKNQLFTPERHGILGPDLASAHFICFRRGKVKFVGYDNWWFDHATLPREFDPLYLIEKIDATGLYSNIFQSE